MVGSYRGQKRKRITPTLVSRKRQYGAPRRRWKRSMPIGKFKILRWSSADGTNNCHVQHTGSDTVPTSDSATVFQLQHVNGFGEITSLFDNYRINRVLYRWVITRNPDLATGAANKGVYPRIVWTHDFNDQIPISRNLIYQRSNMKEFMASDNKLASRWYSIKPSTLVQIYETSTSTSYGPKWRQWMDTSDNNCPHYGIKYSYDNLYAGVNLRLEAKILMECKGVS